MEILQLGPANADRLVLFGAGAGGDPGRYRPLLDNVAAGGCRVVAPCFERLVVPAAKTSDYLVRPAGLLETLRRCEVRDNTSVTIVGHSIGGWAALCLAGAVPYDRDAGPIEVPRAPRVDGLVLFAPAAGWFAAPDALAAVTAPMLVFVGDQDTITPVAQTELLTQAPGRVDIRIVPGADHFSFMDARPPGSMDPAEFNRKAVQPEITRALLEHVRTATDLLTQHRREQSVSNPDGSAAFRMGETCD